MQWALFLGLARPSPDHNPSIHNEAQGRPNLEGATDGKSRGQKKDEDEDEVGESAGERGSMVEFALSHMLNQLVAASQQQTDTGADGAQACRRNAPTH